MSMPLFAAVFFIGAIAVFAWWLVMLVEAVRIPGARWQDKGHNQVVYIILMVFLGVIGTLIYYFVPRPELR
jgi:hypothetical protein